MSDAGAEQKTVLIVDDDPDWRRSLSEVLSHHVPVRTASCAAQALGIARATPPAVIVLDVMMPGGMDGFRTFAELAKGPETRDIPVIFLSAVNSLMNVSFAPSTIRAQLGAEPAAFLEKPVPPQVLIAEVRRAMERPRPPAATPPRKSAR